MLTRFCAAAVSAALLQAFAFSAHAEELHKDGLTSNGVRLNYEATTTPDGRLQIEFTLECRNKGDVIYGAGAFAVINKAAMPAGVQKNQLSCTAKGGLDKTTVSGKATGRIVVSGVSPADIGTKLFVVGRVARDNSPRTEKIVKKAEEALDAEVAKLTAS